MLIVRRGRSQSSSTGIKRPSALAAAKLFGVVRCAGAPIHHADVHRPGLLAVDVGTVPAPCTWVDERLFRERALIFNAIVAFVFPVLLSVSVPARGHGFWREERTDRFVHRPNRPASCPAL